MGQSSNTHKATLPAQSISPQSLMKRLATDTTPVGIRAPPSARQTLDV